MSSPTGRAAPACVLAVNVGSSSLKFALYAAAAALGDPVLSGAVSGLAAGATARAEWRGAAGADAADIGVGADPFAAALEHLRALLAREGAGALLAIAHRVVHGGTCYRDPVVLDDAVVSDLARLAALAPLHQPHNLKGIAVFRTAYPGVPQVACFDTAFHADMPPQEASFALDPALVGTELRRYGFHGLSYQSVCERLAMASARADGRILLAHLGNGASMCAARGGRGIATTMGFTALDGLVMGTRCGALDPGALLYLLERGWTRAALEDLLYRRSGLLGVSGVSADMRALRASQEPRARFAVELFTHRVVREAGALAAVLGGIDLLAFTGGIGENDAVLRDSIGARLAYLGVRIDAAANLAAAGRGATPVHHAASAVEVWVVPSDEGRVAAAAALRLVTDRD